MGIWKSLFGLGSKKPTTSAPLENQAGDEQVELTSAAMDGDVTTMLSLLESGCDINLADTFGKTALYVASSVGNREVVELLLRYGADVDVRNKEGYTALFIAATKGHAEIVKVLLEHGADRSIAGNDGYTPLAIAIDDEVIKLLSGREAEAKSRPSLGESSPEEILEYWPKSSGQACGNCMHYSFPIVGKPICAVPEFLIPDGCPENEIRRGHEVKPEDRCLFWSRRQGG